MNANLDAGKLGKINKTVNMEHNIHKLGEADKAINTEHNTSEADNISDANGANNAKKEI